MFKCHICEKKYVSLDGLLDHYEDAHSDNIPKGWTVDRFYYYGKTGKAHGTCVICGQETGWNTSTSKYFRLCKRHECKEKYVEEFKKRMINKHGTASLLNDPDHQRKMLANRKISGQYEWSDGKLISYTGSYEKDFLQFLDVLLNFESEDILSPSPHTYYYEYEGEKKFYIPDFYIISLNLEIEIKDGGDNPNNHHKIQDVDKVKEQLKDKVMTEQGKFNYVKITNKEYAPFFEILQKLKNDFIENGETNHTFSILAEGQTYVDELRNLEIVTESEIAPNVNRANIIARFASNIYFNINANKIEFKDLPKELDKILDMAKTEEDCDFILLETNNMMSQLKIVKFHDSSLDHEINKLTTWISSIYIPSVKIKKNYIKKNTFSQVVTK